MPLGTESAFAAYEAARHRLPQFTRQGACQQVGSLADIADQFDTFLLDAFGVLNIGDTAIPGAPERVAALQAAGKRVVILTNAASHTLDTLAAKYNRLGYAMTQDDIVSSRMALLAELSQQSAQRFGIVTAPGLGTEDLTGLDFTILGDAPAAYREADAIVMLSAKGWTIERQKMLEESLIERPRPVWVGNPDIVAPREDGFSYEPGYFAHRLADRTGIEPRFFGKPFRNIYELAFAHLGVGADPGRTLMVGDTLHTDVLGAHSAGIASALITGYGFLARVDATRAIAQSNIQPDFVMHGP